MATTARVLTGSAGEHFVAYMLSVKGYVVALPRAGAPSLDLIVATPDGKKSRCIQVKTSTDAYHLAVRKPEDTRWYWRVGKNVLGSSAESLFYAFVDLHLEDKSKPPKPPDVFIIRSSDIREDDIDPSGGPWFIILEKELVDRNWKINDWHLIEEALPLQKNDS